MVSQPVQFFWQIFLKTKIRVHPEFFSEVFWLIFFIKKTVEKNCKGEEKLKFSNSWNCRRVFWKSSLALGAKSWIFLNHFCVGLSSNCTDLWGFFSLSKFSSSQCFLSKFWVLLFCGPRRSQACDVLFSLWPLFILMQSSHFIFYPVFSQMAPLKTTRKSIHM